jgi:hypothetical protein
VRALTAYEVVHNCQKFEKHCYNDYRCPSLTTSEVILLYTGTSALTTKVQFIFELPPTHKGNKTIFPMCKCLFLSFGAGGGGGGSCMVTTVTTWQSLNTEK